MIEAILTIIVSAAAFTAAAGAAVTDVHRKRRHTERWLENAGLLILLGGASLAVLGSAGVFLYYLWAPPEPEITAAAAAVSTELRLLSHTGATYLLAQ